MATGDIATQAETDRDLDVGEARTPTGRLSVARRVERSQRPSPFRPGELARLDEALTLSSRSTGLEFAVYLGDLGEQTREQAESVHGALGARAADGVLIAVSPAQRVVEIVTGEESQRRVPDRSCQLAVMSMVASFKENEYVDGLTSALRMLSDAAGDRRRD
ncbi:DUF5130 family protein [Allosaccharopolyspora coralli]|uniref:DUF5130 family protein n=1 Tax=Allosaccharopolyspora coralli TaxID=2665642 RepID=A0A5Q3QCH2_9PSEU|nr:DUF5130 family protein [Allosaccharopolyspora coralli]QGK69175.1 DUF5130 family protein [Allosaccharopolyspora coralli]